MLFGCTSSIGMLFLFANGATVNASANTSPLAITAFFVPVSLIISCAILALVSYLSDPAIVCRLYLDRLSFVLSTDFSPPITTTFLAPNLLISCATTESN